MMIEQKEAVIFDLDGTMTDSMWIWEEIDQDFPATGPSHAGTSP